jgi:uncharacterized OB-fold protein
VEDHVDNSREFAEGSGGRTPDGAEAPHLTLQRCANSHAFFLVFASCPLCGGKLESFSSPPDAVLISHTVVRVSPTGSPFALGLARAASGAQTLCIIENGVESDPGSDVVITKRDGLYYAAPRARKA